MSFAHPKEFVRLLRRVIDELRYPAIAGQPEPLQLALRALAEQNFFTRRELLAILGELRPLKSTGTVVVLRRDNPFVGYIHKSDKPQAKGWNHSGGWHEGLEAIGATALREVHEEYPVFADMIHTVDPFFTYTIVPTDNPAEAMYDRALAKFYQGRGLPDEIMALLGEIKVRLGVDYDAVFTAFVDGEVDMSRGISKEARIFKCVDLREVPLRDFAYHQGIVTRDVIKWVESGFTVKPNPLIATPRMPIWD